MGWLDTTKFQESDTPQKAIIAVDFDDTIVEGAFPSIGNPNAGAIEVLRELMEAGYRLILYTMRTDDALDQALVYCNKNYINFWGVNENPEQEKWSKSPKIYAHLYIDNAGAGTPLMMGSNDKPCVDWKKLRELFAQWEMLPARAENTDAGKTFEIK
jgi:hypothetical protein